MGTSHSTTSQKESEPKKICIKPYRRITAACSVTVSNVLVWKGDSKSNKKKEDGDILFCGSGVGTITVWNLSNGDLLDSWETARISKISRMKRWNDWLVTASQDLLVNIWAVDKENLYKNPITTTGGKACIATIECGDTSIIFRSARGYAIMGMEILNGNLITASLDGYICIWKYKKNESGGTTFVCSQKIISDTLIECMKVWNKKIAIGYGNDRNKSSYFDDSKGIFPIEIWKEKKHGNFFSLDRKLLGHTNIPKFLEIWWNPIGKDLLICGSYSGNMCIWNSNHDLISTFQVSPDNLIRLIPFRGVLFGIYKEDFAKAWNKKGTLIGYLSKIDKKSLWREEVMDVYEDKLIIVRNDSVTICEIDNSPKKN